MEKTKFKQKKTIKNYMDDMNVAFEKLIQLFVWYHHFFHNYNFVILVKKCLKFVFNLIHVIILRLFLWTSLYVVYSLLLCQFL